MSPIKPDIQGALTGITLMRLLLALAVVFGHAYPLGGFGEEPLARWFASGGSGVAGRELAVRAFFVLSGFLLTLSLLREPSVVRFVIRRASRILPAYWVCLLLTTFVLLPLLRDHAAARDFTYWQLLSIGSDSPLNYLQYSWAFYFLEMPTLPASLALPFGSFINGSLWTLAIEVPCYGLLALCALFGWLRSRWFVIGGVLAMTVIATLPSFITVPWFESRHTFYVILGVLFHPSGPMLAFPFFAGAAWCLLFRGLPPRRPLWLAASAVVLAISLMSPHLTFLRTWALVVLLTQLGIFIRAAWLERAGDWSYGVYIYSFPVQQTLAVFEWHHRGFATYLIASIALSLALGAASWIAIEKPAQQAGSRLIRWLRSRSSAPLPHQPANVS